MRRSILAVAVCGGGLAVAAAAFAQTRPPGGPDGPFGRGGPGQRAAMTSADREAFTDARIAALKAGLRLTPDQDKLWPAVEDALRGLAKQRAEARAARRERWASLRDGDMRDGDTGDLPGRLRSMAARQAASADALRRLADASAPLHATLDEAQRRRLRILARLGPMAGGDRPGWHHGGGR